LSFNLKLLILSWPARVGKALGFSGSGLGASCEGFFWKGLKEEPLKRELPPFF